MLFILGRLGRAKNDPIKQILPWLRRLQKDLVGTEHALEILGARVLGDGADQQDVVVGSTLRQLHAALNKRTQGGGAHYDSVYVIAHGLLPSKSENGQLLSRRCSAAVGRMEELADSVQSCLRGGLRLPGGTPAEEREVVGKVASTLVEDLAELSGISVYLPGAFETKLSLFGEQVRYRDLEIEQRAHTSTEVAVLSCYNAYLFPRTRSGSRRGPIQAKFVSLDVEAVAKLLREDPASLLHTTTAFPVTIGEKGAQYPLLPQVGFGLIEQLRRHLLPRAGEK